MPGRRHGVTPGADGQQQPRAGGQQGGAEALILPEQPVHGPHRPGVLLPVGRLRHLVLGQGVVDHEHPARSQQPDRLLRVVQGPLGVAVEEHEVVGAGAQPGHHEGRAAGDGAGPARGDPGLPERVAGRAQRPDVGVDRRQHGRPGQPAQQGEPGHPGPRAHLDHRGGPRRRREHGQGGGRSRGDRGDAQGEGAFPGAVGELVLGGERLGVRPARRLVRAHGPPFVAVVDARHPTG